MVKVLLDKLDLTNSPSSFILQQITPNGKFMEYMSCMYYVYTVLAIASTFMTTGNMTIPEGATVYYALATDPGTVPQLRLQPKDRHSS